VKGEFCSVKEENVSLKAIVSQLQKENAELKKENAEQAFTIAKLEKENAQHATTIAQLVKENAELKKAFPLNLLTLTLFFYLLLLKPTLSPSKTVAPQLSQLVVMSGVKIPVKFVNPECFQREGVRIEKIGTNYSDDTFAIDHQISSVYFFFLFLLYLSSQGIWDLFLSHLSFSSFNLLFLVLSQRKMQT
jgi:hypothetical protein